MGTFILVTVGTSLPGHLKRKLSCYGLPPLGEALSLLQSQEPFARSAGAEINATEHLLHGLDLSTGRTSPPFELFFAVSETAEGRWTGELLAQYYRAFRGFEKVQWKEMEGLSPADPERFTHVGLRSLVRESSASLRDASRRGLHCVVNATGGFKAQISVAGLIGQAMGVSVVYQFEGFPNCIEMPPMPLELDRELWLTNYDLLARLSREWDLSEHDFPFHEVDPLILSLLEHDEEQGDRRYSMTPVLELMHQGFLSRGSLVTEEPPQNFKARTPVEEVLRQDLDRHIPGAARFIRSMMETFPWILDIRNHSRGLVTGRCRLLPRTPDPSVQSICLSDGVKGIGLSVITTARFQSHVAYVRTKLAEALAEHSLLGESPQGVNCT